MFAFISCLTHRKKPEAVLTTNTLQSCFPVFQGVPESYVRHGASLLTYEWIRGFTRSKPLITVNSTNLNVFELHLGRLVHLSCTFRHDRQKLLRGFLLEDRGTSESPRRERPPHHKSKVN